MIAHLPTSYDVPEQSDFKIIAHRQLFRRDVDKRRMIPTITVNLNLSFDFFSFCFITKHRLMLLLNYTGRGCHLG